MSGAVAPLRLLTEDTPVESGAFIFKGLQRETVFVSIWNATQQRGAAALLKTLTVEAWFSQIAKFVGPAESCEVKAILQTGSPVISALRDLKKAGVKKVLVAETSGMAEIFWYGESGRIRFAEDVASIELRGRGVAPVPLSDPLSSKRRVLIVDDSATIRKLLRSVFAQDSDLEVVGEAEHPGQVESLIQKLRPDVITMDVHMPDEDGVSLFARLFPVYRVPTVMITSVSLAEGNHILRALELGAVDYIQKPSMNELSVLAPIIIEKIKVAASVKVKSGVEPKALKSAGWAHQPRLDLDRLFVMGASTGGTEALRQVLMAFPQEIPPILIVQHIPAVFSTAFARRLNELCPFEVKEAEDGDSVLPNRVLIAPGGKQMAVMKGAQGDLKVRVTDDEPVNRHKPSVDYLFDSVSRLGLKRVSAAILTGMGSDGAQGLLKLKQVGAFTLAQDEATSIVYGMPRAAAMLGAALQVKPLHEIAEAMVRSAQKI
jgi:two-component system chemotaxis response regulator CheB